MTVYTFQNTQPRIHPSVYLAPTAQIIGDVGIGEESSIWFQTVLRGDLGKIRVGKQTNIQDLCMCHVDENIHLTIGDGVTVGHRSILHGCTVEDECLIGMGSIVLNHAVIGTGSVVAAGTIVLEKTIIPPYSLVTGSPGKIKKTYENRQAVQMKMEQMSQTYMQCARAFGSEQSFYPATEGESAGRK
jgi:carbonic anhydrase/acetyltransferase-like protein (isoleucine patch superfamily)